MLRSHVEPRGALDEVFNRARVVGSLVCLDFQGRDLDDFLVCLDQTAHSAQNVEAMDRLGDAFRRIEAGLTGTVDPGWHMLRPASIRAEYTTKQGQYLSFILAYSRLHRRAPAESDLQAYFGASPPAIHGALKTLQRQGFISRRPGEARSIRLLLKPHEIPELE